MRRGVFLAAVPSALLIGASAARALMKVAPPRIAIDRMQPLTVVTAWGGFGGQAFALLCTAIAIAALACAIATTRTRPMHDDDLRYVLALAALGVAACAAWPFVFSSAVYAYAAYGDLADRGFDPYRIAPPALHDGLVDAARWQWGGVFPPCVYGPAFVVFARAVVAFAHTFAATPAATLALFRTSAALAFLASIGFARRAMRALPATVRANAVVAYALNPVVLWSVAEGHNDIYAILAATAVGALTTRRRTIGRAFALPFAALFKASVAIFAIVYALDQTIVRRRAAARIVIATLAGFALTAAVAIPPLLPAFDGVAVSRRYHAVASLAVFAGRWGAATVACGLAAVGLVALMRTHRSGYAWLGLAIVAALPNDYPWYGVCLVPLALPSLGSAASRTLWVVTICALVRYLPDAYGYMSPGATLAIATVATLPIAFAFFGLRADIAPPPEERRSP